MVTMISWYLPDILYSRHGVKCLTACISWGRWCSIPALLVEKHKLREGKSSQDQLLFCLTADLTSQPLHPTFLKLVSLHHHLVYFPLNTSFWNENYLCMWTRHDTQWLWSMLKGCCPEEEKALPWRLIHRHTYVQTSFSLISWSWWQQKFTRGSDGYSD